MAEQRPDIWNDDDGEAEEKRRGRLRRLLPFLVILAVVLVIVLVAAWRDGTGFDALRRLFSYETPSAEEPAVYRYEASADSRFAMLGDCLAVLSNTNLQILDGSGEEVWSAAVNMDAPALMSAGGQAVAYDVGGSELYVVDAEGERLHLTAGAGEPFIAANLSEDGYLAVTTQRQTSKGQVAVYDPEMDLIFEFNSSQRFVTDACVVDGRFLAAVTLGQEAGTFVSNIVLYRLDQEEPAADYDVEDGLTAAIAEWDGDIVTVSDTCLTFAGTDGEISASYAYNGAFLRGYDLGGSGFIALLLNRYSSGSVGRMVTVDAAGEELASLDVNREVLDISAAGRYLAVLYTDGLVIYNPDLEVYATLDELDYASSVLMRADGSALLLSAEYATLFLP